MAVALFLEKTQPKSIGRQHTYAGKWPSQLSKADCANVRLSSYLMRSVSPNHSRYLSRPTALSREH